MKLRKRRGESLIELILSLLILSFVIGSAFDFLASELRFIEKLRRSDAVRWDTQRRLSRGL